MVGSDEGQTAYFNSLAVSYGGLLAQAVVYFASCLFL